MSDALEDEKDGSACLGIMVCLIKDSVSASQPRHNAEWNK